ncbi:MAG: hypothetical protein OHK0015_39130 [Chloroflexi bacterium OHK40]
MRRVVLPALTLLLFVVLVVVGQALALPRATPSATGAVRVEQVDPSAYPEITLYVSAADDAGKPRLGLGRDDFRITEDGAPVQLIGFGGAGDEAVASALVIDRSGSMDEEAKLEGAREAASAFVDLLRPGDQAALLAFNEDVELIEGFTDDIRALHDAIDTLDADGGTALYDAVVAGVELLRDQEGRRLLLVLTDGQDMRESDDRREQVYGSERSLTEAIAYAVEAGQPVVVIGLGERGSTGDDGVSEAVLERIAAETGGRYVYAPRADELAALYAGLAAGVQQEYRLTYVSPRPFYDGTRRDIRVLVGGVETASSYTERHLINVTSSPLVGLVLLAPLVILLILPEALRRRASRAVPDPIVGRYATAAPPAVLVAGAGPLRPNGAVSAPVRESGEPTARTCHACGASLRPTARFCARCGARNAIEGDAR